VLLAFTLYADRILSITQIAPFLGRAYKTVHKTSREVEAALQRGFPVIWSLLGQTIDGPTQVDESDRVCSGYKGREADHGSDVAEEYCSAEKFQSRATDDCSEYSGAPDTSDGEPRVGRIVEHRFGVGSSS
jgi:hypothetical protein